MSCNEVKTTQVLLLAFWNLASVSWYWNINVRFCLINHALIRIRRWYRCAVLKQFPRIRFMSKSPRTTRAALLRCDHGLSAYTQPQSPSFHLHLVSRNSSSIVPAVANCQTLRHRNTSDPSSPGLKALLYLDALWQIGLLQRLRNVHNIHSVRRTWQDLRLFWRFWDVVERMLLRIQRWCRYGNNP